MCNEIIQELNDRDRADALEAARRAQEWVVLSAREYPTMTGSFVYHDEGDIVTDIDPLSVAWFMGLGLITPVPPEYLEGV